MAYNLLRGRMHMTNYINNRIKNFMNFIMKSTITPMK